MFNNKPDPRYGKKWPKTRNKAKAMLNGECTLCGSQALEVHHGYYGKRGLFGHVSKPDLEVSGVSVFPLCMNHHSRHKGMAHYKDNYIFGKDPWKNHNTAAYLWKLRLNFWFKFIFQNVIEFVFGVFTFYIVFKLLGI